MTSIALDYNESGFELLSDEEIVAVAGGDFWRDVAVGAGSFIGGGLGFAAGAFITGGVTPFGIPGGIVGRGIGASAGGGIAGEIYDYFLDNPQD